MTLQNSLLLASVLAFTSVTNSYTPPSANCKNFSIPVHVTSDNYAWTGPKWTDNYGLIDFVSMASSRADAGFPSPFGNASSQNGTYEIGATFCTPKQPNNKTSTVLLATHGLAYDRSYWNSPYKPDQYNFVQYATQKGYSVFFYDRLGVGSSSKISSFVNQVNIQISILSSLVSSIRSGRYTLLSGAPKSVVLVGHSYGSVLSNSLVAVEPAAVDGVILTGHGLQINGPVVLEALAPRVASLHSPEFAALDAGYVVTVDLFSTINGFFKAPDYEHDVAAFSDSTKQPFAIFELLSGSPLLANYNATAYKGPALVISGEYDFVCGGYCPGELEPSFAPLFSGAKNFETYVQPLSGHGTNFAKNATGFYGVIFEYLARNGL